MPDDWKTPSDRRLIGHFRDAGGYDVAFSVDRGAVIIRRGGQDMRLGAAERDHFQQVYMQAEREAEAWTAAPAGAVVVWICDDCQAGQCGLCIEENETQTPGPGCDCEHEDWDDPAT